MQLLNAICNRPWVIEPSYLQLIIDVVTGEKRDEELAARIAADREARPAAMAMRRGERLDGTRGVTVRDGVAHVAVVGPIVRYSDFFTRVSGLASLEQTAADIQAALDSPDVRALLLELDTPGGEVTGVAALAEQLYAARERKPVWAYVDGMAASAGYWIGSAASHIVTDPAGLLGSIGAVLAVRDPAAGPDRGRIEFVSSQSPHKRANPTTDAGRAQYQRIVDQTAEAFIAAVARHRGVSAADVVERYGAGGLLVGRHAVAAGLADEVGTFETALAALAQRTRKETLMPSWKDMWAGFFGAAQEAGAFTASDGAPPAVAASLLAAEQSERGGINTPPAQPKPDVAPPAQKPQAAAADPEQAERLAAAEQRAKDAEARLAVAEQRERETKVAAFVAEAVRSGHAFPAEQEALTALASALVADDARFGLLAGLIKTRPVHGMAQELLPANADVTALPVQRTAAEDADVAQARANATAYAQRANGKRPA